MRYQGYGITGACLLPCHSFEASHGLSSPTDSPQPARITNPLNSRPSRCVAGRSGGVAVGTLVPVRALDCAGEGTVSNIIAALNWVVARPRPPPSPGLVFFSSNLLPFEPHEGRPPPQGRGCGRIWWAPHLRTGVSPGPADACFQSARPAVINLSLGGSLSTTLRGLLKVSYILPSHSPSWLKLVGRYGEKMFSA